MAMGAVSAGWFPDPTGRHEYRYWDGVRWADQVSDRGVTDTDPVVAAPPVVAAVPRPSEPPVLAAAPVAPVLAPVVAAREVVVSTRTFGAGAAIAGIGVIAYTIVAMLSAVIGTQVRAGSVPSDFACAIGTKGSPSVTAVYTAGLLLPILGFASSFLLPSGYRLSRYARTQWGGGASRWSSATRNSYRAYLMEHVGTVAIYRRSVVGKLIALSVCVVAMLGLAILMAVRASSYGFTLQFGAFALLVSGAAAVIGVIVAWCAKRRVLHVDETGRFLDA